MAYRIGFLFFLLLCILGSVTQCTQISSSEINSRAQASVVRPSTTLSTGKVRKYNFTISRGHISPGGFNKSAILVNGQFPGPTIRAKYGDTFQITVCNNISDPEEGTTIHWHGMLQTGTPWYDGVAAITQCPIAPGKSMTYTFLADSYGTSFYHSHYSAQYIDGVYGAIVIEGPASASYDIDLGPTDHFHSTYYENLKIIEAVPAQLPLSDNNLINGRNAQKCTTNSTSSCSPISGGTSFNFETGKRYRLRLINAGAEGLQRFSIDNHSLTVIANDFVPILPYTSQVVSLGVGQRMDVIVEGIGSPNDAFWMRTDISSLCAGTKQPHGFASIYYPKANKLKAPNSTGHAINDTSCTNDPISSSVPWQTKTPPSTQGRTLLNTTLGLDATNHSMFYVNNVSFRGDYNKPILLSLANKASASSMLSNPPPQLNLYNYKNDLAIRLVLVNPSGASHPMHLHGHDFYILAEGWGTWDGTVANPSNPTRKDVHLFPPGTPDRPAYLVIEIEANNPGVWAFHCHIAWHLSLGLNINILDHPKTLQSMRFPKDSTQICEDWRAWRSKNQVSQTDSGP